MNDDAAQPADTRMMGIVHEALRRDLRRARHTAALVPHVPASQRVALATHLGWMMDVLHHHHAGEDAGLFPMLRARNPAAAALVDEMASDHLAISSGVEALRRAAREYAVSTVDGAANGLLASIDQLEGALLPHLRREEDVVMPVVSSCITAAEWRALDEEYNLKPKSFLELGREGHWLIDGLDQADRAVVVNLVPPLPRFILLHAFAGSYRRHLSRCWGMSPERRRVRRADRVDVLVPADPAQVAEVVRDVTRVGEWSHECRGAAWMGSATHAAVGARFRGRNRAGVVRWGRVCEIVTLGPRELVWRTVPSLLYPDSAEWTIRISDAEGGSRIEMSYTVLRLPKVLDVCYAYLVPSHTDRSDALSNDLRRLGEVASRARREPEVAGL